MKIPGIMLSDVKVRTYYLKEVASHLVGYVQAVTAEDLQEHKGEGYRTNSVIGKTEMCIRDRYYYYRLKIVKKK